MSRFRSQYKFLFLFILVTMFFSFSQKKPEGKLFSFLPASHTQVYFRNDIAEDGNLFFYKYEYLYNGGGVSVGDINNDGLQDLYFTSTLGYNKLYLNLGNFQFRDITEQAGVNGGIGMKSGVNMVDINNDGWLDVFVSKSGPTDPVYRKKLLYINNGNLTFTEKASEYGLDDASFTTQSYFFDYDNDGDKDVYFVNHPGDFTNAMLIPAKMVNGKMVYAEDTAKVYVSDRLYENQNGRFKDVTQKAGLINHAFGLSASVYDFNSDGWPDIYVANDFMKPDFLYINNRKGGFTEKFSEYMDHTSLSSMGSDMNDINNDGLEDLFVVDMAIEDPVRQKQLFVQNLNYDKFQLLLQFNLKHQYPRNVLQLNHGGGRFSDIGYFTGMAQTDWSWAVLMADWDNNGHKDVYITNGYKRDVTDWDYKNFILDSIKNVMARGVSVNLEDWFKLIPQTRVKNYLYRNNGTLWFDNYSDLWADQLPSFSNSAAYADLDNDGDLDLVVNNIDDPAFIIRNNSRETEQTNYIRFRMFRSPADHYEPYGTVVKITDQHGNQQLNRLEPQRGYMGTTEHVVHFGLGEQTSVAAAEIIFPSGKMTRLNQLASNQVITLYESDATDPVREIKQVSTLFSAAVNGFSFHHKENVFIDFKREPLIPYMCSRKGPFFAQADVNGDGLDDIYIGGAAGFEGILMIQQPNGSFTEKKQAAFTADKLYEDGGVLFFDADGDKDMDLYVVSGGAEFPAGSSKYQDRLYKNDGKGNFIKTASALPKIISNGSVVLAFDYDDDGDQDLFIGGAVMPGRFPEKNRNIILQNDKGIFRDVTESLAPNLNQTGIINSADWADTDGDGKNELILAGEWMPVMIIKLKPGNSDFLHPTVRYNNKIVPMSDISGWWNVVKAVDIDGDGDLDLVAGNRGLNSKISASLEEPCVIYAKDFDGSGSYDAVLGYYIWGKCYPMYHRDQLIDQMPFMRKRFIRYHQYAGTTMDELFTEEEKKGMDIFKTTCFESGVFINEGNHQFRFEPFPEMAQFSTINDLLIRDFDGDGIKDIVVAGNSNDPDVSTGNYDAQAALLLKGNGKGRFTAVPNTKSGLKIKGEVRRIIYLKEKNQLIYLKNNLPASVYSSN